MSGVDPAGLIGAGSAEEAADFAARAMRFSPEALVRLRPSGDGTGRLWTVLPFRVLACRTVATAHDDDVTVRAADLLRSGPPSRHDGSWRTTLPTSDGEVLETLPGAEVVRLDRAAGETLRSRRGQGVGDRRLRDALLDHVAVTVVGDETKHEVPLRLIVGLLRMGLHDAAAPVSVRLAGRRIGLTGAKGSVWGLEAGLRVL
ncbi:hypothetical protein [Phytomonospora endophytica]|uniref:Uncharacterized protein n=1 Tax=Phytomonospora endophytica TaxID=714109 RepID=A0A841F7S6_9ACTN|nr:hypothetical protein [Phytomonospora endophytica]MBB6032266.1 hypothetical protein [Phytomonospora endophytica]GIG68616.1 hypothetical protein Pen01_49110 [Phytomonospora endophytica]